MRLSFSPVRSDERLDLAVDGDVLTVNGEPFDFSALPEGATLPRSAVAYAWLGSDVERIDGELYLTMILPHGPAAPTETLFPATVIATDGPVPLPPYARAITAEEDPET
jgi:hypothetical protein